MTRFLARRLLNYVVLLMLASFLTFALASLVVQTARQPRRPQPPAAAGRHRRQGRRTRTSTSRSRCATSHWVSDAVRGRLRHHRRGPAGVRRAVAAHRRQPATGVHRLGARHRHRRGGRCVGRDPAVPAVRPRHHRAVAAGDQHADVRRRQPADPRRAARQHGVGRSTVRVHRRDVAERDGRRVEPVRRPPAAPRAADVHAWRWARSPASAAISATRCSTCSARTSSAPRAPRG